MRSFCSSPDRLHICHPCYDGMLSPEVSLQALCEQSQDHPNSCVISSVQRLTLFSKFWPNYLSTSKLFFWCHNCSGFLKSSNKEAGFHLGLWQRKPCHTSLLSTSLLTPTESSNTFARQMHNLTLTKHAILIQISSNSSFCYSFYAVSSVFVKLPDHMYHLLVQRHLQASSYTVL